MSQSGSRSHDAVTVIRSDDDRPVSSPELKPGERIGVYELRFPIGSGGMATVWKAHDSIYNRDVALKILPNDLASNPDHLTRFRLEAQSAAALDHPNIAKAYDCGEANGRSFIAFEYVPGENLRQLIEAQGTIPPADAVRYLIDCVTGLEHAATRGVVHRDVKPANIVITPEGRAVIIDMGLARQHDAIGADGGVTRSGMTLGTFDYVSPEQAIDPRKADFRSDLYSLGCTFYHALTGTVPVPEGTAARKLQFHQHEKPLDPRLLNPAIPFDLAWILSRLLMKDPAQRYQSASSLLADLKIVAEQLKSPGSANRISTSPTALPVSWAAGVVFLLVAIIIGINQFSSPLPPTANDPSARIIGLTSNPKTEESQPSLPVAISPDGFSLPRSGEELAEHLREGRSKIRLRSGIDYDLTGIDPINVTLSRLELETISGQQPARIIVPAQGDTLAFRGSSILEFRNLTIRTSSIETDRPAPSPCGIAFEKVSSVEWVGCRFELSEQLQAGKVASLELSDTNFTIRNCLFPIGSVAIRLNGHCQGSVQESAFGPHESIFDLNEGHGTLTLKHCTGLLRPENGAVFDVDPLAQFSIEAGHCLFAAATTPNAATVMMGQRVAPSIIRANAVRSISWKSIPEQPNAFFRIDALAAGDVTIPFDRRSEVGITDSQVISLSLNPWAEPDPLSLLRDDSDAWRAFRLRLDLAAVRVPRDVVVGVRFRTSDGLQRIYPGDWPPPKASEFTSDPVKTWWPSAPVGASLPANTSRQLDELIAIAKPGDIIEIRHDGTLPVHPVKWNWAGGSLTIRATEGSRPILIPESPGRPADVVMFDVADGDLSFERLEFQIDGHGSDLKNLSLVRFGSGSNVSFKNCVVTVDEADWHTNLATMLPVDLEMMKAGALTAVPRLKLSDCFIRGKGRVFVVPSARPFTLDVQQSLIALDGVVLSVDGSARDRTSEGRCQFAIQNTTVILVGSLMQLKAGNERTREIDVESNHNLFASLGRPTKPFISIIGVDATATFDTFVNWTHDKPSRYANYDRSGVLAELIPIDPLSQAMSITIDLENWLKRTTHEPVTMSGRVRFRKPPFTASGFLETLPPDWTITRGKSDSTLIEPIGADLNQLPKPIR